MTLKRKLWIEKISEELQAVIKKIFLHLMWAVIWILSIWYIVIMVINCQQQLPWKLFLYDLFSDFRDNRIYLTKIFLPVTVFITVFGILSIFFLENCIVMYLEVRIRGCCFHMAKIRPVRKHKRMFMVVPVVGAAGLLAVTMGAQIFGKHESTWDGGRTIAHAGGIIDGYDYTNCLEAILTNYNNGHRVFEIDFAVTSDNKLVCKHGWKTVLQEGGTPDTPMDEQTFMSTPILGQYTPLSFETLCQLMNEYPDIWVVTDTKNSKTEAVQQDFEMIVNTARECGMESVLDRLIVQIYNEEMYDTVYNIYPFRSWIYTLYKFWGGARETFRDCVRFCYEHDIDGITTWNYYVTPELMQIARAYDIPWYAHTENDVENAENLFRQGLAGIYTDSITPDMLTE